MPIMKAERKRFRLRMLLDGPSGSGKTATGLLFASAIAKHYGGEVGVIDTENERSLSYVDTPWAPQGFQIFPLANASPDSYRNALRQFATIPEIKVVFIDSLSHAWAGEGGILEMSTGYDDKSSFSKWNELGKHHNKVLTAITSAPFHVIASARVKTEWSIGRTSDGKQSIERAGTSMIQRKGIEYEFNIYGRLDQYHKLTIHKTDCSAIDGVEVMHPDATFMTPILEWLDTGKATTEIEVHSRRATTQQLEEYYGLMLRHGYKPDQVDLSFYRKYGSKPAECSEDFLDERLEELRAKRLVPRPNGEKVENKVDNDK